jgi:hypothetical protein
VRRKLWSGIKRFFHGLGLVQNFILLSIFYFLLFGPLALIVRLTGRDLLGLRARGRESFWVKRRKVEPSLERARRQS